MTQCPIFNFLMGWTTTEFIDLLNENKSEYVKVRICESHVSTVCVSMSYCVSCNSGENFALAYVRLYTMGLVNTRFWLAGGCQSTFDTQMPMELLKQGYSNFITFPSN